MPVEFVNAGMGIKNPFAPRAEKPRLVGAKTPVSKVREVACCTALVSRSSFMLLCLGTT